MTDYHNIEKDKTEFEIETKILLILAQYQIDNIPCYFLQLWLDSEF